jgi:2-polyprenyl-3-methyl-5-hydroxy-6-metoxy-1,4-benzoquinol methylase
MMSEPKSTKGRRSFTSKYFDELYARDDDPWRFATSPYERSKYLVTLEILKGQPLGAVFEIGCSIGILTRALASNCNSVLAVDGSEIALANARKKCDGLVNVTLAQMRIPDEWPGGSFDLILFSEVLYFLGPDDIQVTARKTVQSLSPGGRVLLVNWLGDTDYPCSGDEACNIFISTAKQSLKVVQWRRNENYRLDLLRHV